MIRFVHFFNYAADVSIDTGEKWYLNDHVPKVKAQSGVLRYLSWRALEVTPDTRAPAPFDQFVRMSELCFENLEAWKQSGASAPELWRSTKKGFPGFGELECLLLDVEPQYDLMRDVPPQQYKYLTLPLMWPNGVPEIDDTGDLVIDMYFFNYRKDIPVADGEDWYIGHHNREGKQMPGIKRYRTWRPIRVPEDPSFPCQLNRWYRLTELGVPSVEAFNKVINGEQRIRFTPSPLGNVLGEWRNIFINPDNVEIFL
jgi:hypothetical protein